VPGAQSEWRTARPAPSLSTLIERYQGYRLVGFPPGLHRGLPSRHMTLIVSIGNPIDVVAQTDPAQTPDRYGVVVGGLQASSALIAHDGNQEGVAIELTPVGCRTLLGLPARALWNRSVELGDIVGGIGRELWERLQGVEGWPERFTVCDAVLTRLVTNDVVAPELRRSWDLLVESGGTMSIAGLAADVGWSRQHLARRFGDEFGLGPRLAGRVVRFERARRMLASTPSYVTIAQVAATCGYYDHAHLTHDFVELAGCSPSTWRAEELPSFQDDDVPTGAP
jgi:AraC-like DNA-binding protein